MIVHSAEVMPSPSGSPLAHLGTSATASSAPVTSAGSTLAAHGLTAADHTAGVARFFGDVRSGVATSNTQHLETFALGLKMFLAHPLFGAGLGAFVESVARMQEPPLLIHSTPLWLLAETGIFGFGAFAAPFVLLLRGALRQRSEVIPV